MRILSTTLTTQALSPVMAGLIVLSGIVEAKADGQIPQIAGYTDSRSILPDVNEEVVVTGTRTEQLYAKSPVKVELVTAVDMERRHVQNAAEALENVPGLQIDTIRGKEGKSVSMQGVSADRVLVLIDGEPVSASTGTTVDLTQIATSLIERIEVVKGATSALYGSAAMGGVVNIITKKPEEGMQLQLSLDTGSYLDANTNGEVATPARSRFDLATGFTNEHLSVQAGLNAVVSEGFNSDQDDWTQPGPKGEKVTGSLSGTWYATENSEHSLQASHYSQALTTRYLNEVGGGLGKETRQDDVERTTFKVNSHWEWDIWDLAYGATVETFVNESRPSLTDYRKADMTYSNADAQVNVDLGIHTLTAGFDLTQETLQQSKAKAGEVTDELGGEQNQEISELYLQDHLDFGPLQLLPGIRLQYDESFGFAKTPKINGRLDLVDDDERTIFLRGGVGKGYRVPSLKELHFVFDHSHLGYKVLGNADLEPEESISYQLGFGIHNKNNYTLDLNFFYNDFTNLITEQITDETEGSVRIYRYANVSRARSQGVEINVRFPFTDYFATTAGYSYIDAKDLDTGFRLNGKPRHLAKAQLDWLPASWLDMSLSANFRSSDVSYEVSETENTYRKYSSKAFTELNLKVNSYLTDSFSLYGGIDNITDVVRDYGSAYDNRPVDGRYVYLGFKYQY